MTVTYERLHETPALIAAQMSRFIGVYESNNVVADYVAHTWFATLRMVGRRRRHKTNRLPQKKIGVGWRSNSRAQEEQR